jgi:hypothetical protein
MRNYLLKPFFIFNVFLRNLQRPKKSTTLKNRKKVFSRLPKNLKNSFSPIKQHVLKWFVVLISKQQRGDVVSSGKHMGIAFSATEHIAAGKTKVYTNLIIFQQIHFISDVFVQVYKNTTSTDIPRATIKRYIG